MSQVTLELQDHEEEPAKGQDKELPVNQEVDQESAALWKPGERRRIMNIKCC